MKKEPTQAVDPIWGSQDLDVTEKMRLALLVLELKTKLSASDLEILFCRR